MSTEPENRPDAYRPEQGAPGAFSPRPPAGTVAWAMGFLAFIPIPFLGSIITGIVMMLVGNGQKDKGEIARLNGRNAANWGLTYLLLTVVLIGGSVLVGVISSGGGGPTPDWAPPIALTLIGIWAFPVQIAHLIVTIMGTIRASRAVVFSAPVAVPFLR